MKEWIGTAYPTGRHRGWLRSYYPGINRISDYLPGIVDDVVLSQPHTHIYDILIQARIGAPYKE
jgi:hypothetical protein